MVSVREPRVPSDRSVAGTDADVPTVHGPEGASLESHTSPERALASFEGADRLTHHALRAGVELARARSSADLETRSHIDRACAALDDLLHDVRADMLDRVDVTAWDALDM